jgi:phage recombination protein Bet
MTEIATRPIGHLTVSPDQTAWTDEQALVLKQAGVDNDVTHAELTGFLHLTQRTGLDPFSRQIYLIGRYDSRSGRKVFSPQTGIDGYRIVAQRTAERTGTPLSYDDSLWCGEDGAWHDVWLSKEPPRAAKVTVYRGASKFSAVATYDEYVQTKKGGEPTNMWARMPAVMLAKCAESLALRKAFPHDLAGVYTTEEMMQADNPARAEVQRPAQRHQSPIDDDQWQTPAPQPDAKAAPAEVEYADVAEDQTPPEATQQQLEMIAGGLKAVRGVTEYDAILTAVSQIVEREIGRPDELTAEEADLVLTTLRDEQKAKATQQRQQSETAMAPDVKPKYASGAQLTALKDALAEQKGIAERTAILAWCAGKVERQLGALKDLYADEADRLIGELTPAGAENAPLIERLTTAMRASPTSDELADVSELMWTEHEAGNLTQADVSKLQDISLTRESEIIATGKAAA